jgi:hypothetical protein
VSGLPARNARRRAGAGPDTHPRPTTPALASCNTNWMRVKVIGAHGRACEARKRELYLGLSLWRAWWRRKEAKHGCSWNSRCVGTRAPPGLRRRGQTGFKHCTHPPAAAAGTLYSITWLLELAGLGHLVCCGQLPASCASCLLRQVVLDVVEGQRAAGARTRSTTRAGDEVTLVLQGQADGPVAGSAGQLSRRGRSRSGAAQTHAARQAVVGGRQQLAASARCSCSRPVPGHHPHQQPQRPVCHQPQQPSAQPPAQPAPPALRRGPSAELLQQPSARPAIFGVIIADAGAFVWPCIASERRAASDAWASPRPHALPQPSPPRCIASSTPH